MAFNDALSDMLARIKNAHQARIVYQIPKAIRIIIEIEGPQPYTTADAPAKHSDHL